MTLQLDEVTLAILEAACQTDNDEERSHLLVFCQFGAEPIGEQDLGGGIEEIIDVPGTEPESPHSIILDLITEVRRLRDRCPD